MSHQYDIAISFAGEDRSVAEKIANELIKLKVRVFYDELEEAELWGKDLYQHFQTVYQKISRYGLILISKHYMTKEWARHELKQMQARALKEDGYILPVRIDNSEIPGLNNTIGYIDFHKTGEEKIAQLIVSKLCSSLTVWKLFDFLRTTNPQVVRILEEKQNNLPVLVSSSRTYLINEFLNETDLFNYVTIQATHNFIMNGVGIKGYILDKAGQPWESYIFELKDKFFTSIKI